jgi:formamidopyrimidine-DNA glycosylase
MPELPEVETIARFLREGGRNSLPILGKTLSGGQALWPRTLETPFPARFAARLKGQQISSVGRRAKFIVIKLTTDTLLIHLRMSGDLRCESAKDNTGKKVQLQPHDRLVLDFTDQTRLVFNDTRKFGRVWLLADPQTVLGQLGPEPLDPALTAETFHHMLAARRRQLKPLLLDQTFLAGLGNIYTDESLHLARLHPLTLSDSLDPAQAETLLLAIHSVLEEGIRRNGASIDWVYRGGDFQNVFRVYQRTGQPCPVCGTPIKRITVDQRSTHFCPVCQPKP